jgi:hypothetical protein
MIKNKEKYFEDMLSCLQVENSAVEIAFVLKNKENNSYEVFRGELSQDVTKNIKDTCIKACKKSYQNVNNKSFINYDPAMPNTGREFLTELDEIKPILTLIDNDGNRLAKVDKSFLDNLWFYIIKVGNQTNGVYIYKKYSQGFILTKGFKRALGFRAGNFGKLTQDIFTISDKIDCIYFNDNLIIRSKGNFEKIFNFIKKIRSNAKEAIKIVKTSLPFQIETLQNLEPEWMKRELMMRKLNNIYSKNVLNKIKPDRIKQVISRGLVNNITFKEDSSGKLILNSNDPWAILKILDDDFLKSLLTDIEYEAGYKKRLNSQNGNDKSSIK